MSEPILSGRYKILKKLGEGGFGQTFLAEDWHLPTKPHCVVKRLKSQFSDEESFKLAHRLFEQEADVLYRLGNHPSIPNLLAHFENDGEFFLVQEYIEGATLAQEFAAGKRYSEVEAVRFLADLLETLSYVHQQNVIHRDIKPSNMIHRASDGRLFLIDFGAVKQVSVNPFNQHPTFKSTVAIGTSGYAPSEQTIGKPRYASDIYAAGLVAIQALTGMNPLQLKNNDVTGEFMWQHKIKLRPEITNFIAKLSRYDFRQRYNSATEAFFGLNLIAANYGIRLNVNQSQLPRSNPVPNNLPKFNAPYNRLQMQAGNNVPQFIPPTIIQPQGQSPVSAITLPRNNQNFHPQSQVTLQPPIHQFQSRQDLKSPETPKTFWGRFWSNDFAIVSTVVIAVFGLFFLGGYILVSNLGSGDNQLVSENQIENAAPEMSPNDTFQEAQNMASETAEKQKRAKTKAEWEQIAKEYRRVNTVLAAIEPTSPNYQRAKEIMADFEERAENADKNAAMIIDKISNAPSPITTSTTPNYPLSTTSSTTPNYPSSYSTPLLAKPQIAKMPPPRKEKMYISFNRSPYDARGSIISKIVTAAEGDFTASIGNSGAYSGSVTIRVNGGPDSCDVTFIAPHSERLQRGTYSDAQRYPFQSPTKPGLDFSGTGGCNTVAGSFTINDILYGSDGKSIVMLYATFIHRCGETSPPTMGRVHYDARY